MTKYMFCNPNFSADSRPTSLLKLTANFCNALCSVPLFSLQPSPSPSGSAAQCVLRPAVHQSGGRFTAAGGQDPGGPHPPGPLRPHPPGSLRLPPAATLTQRRSEHTVKEIGASDIHVNIYLYIHVCIHVACAAFGVLNGDCFSSDYVCVLDMDWFELTLRLCNSAQFEEESQKVHVHC